MSVKIRCMRLLIFIVIIIYTIRRSGAMLRASIDSSALAAISPLRAIGRVMITVIIVFTTDSYVAKHINEHSCHNNYATYYYPTKQSCNQQTENCYRNG